MHHQNRHNQQHTTPLRPKWPLLRCCVPRLRWLLLVFAFLGMTTLRTVCRADDGVTLGNPAERDFYDAPMPPQTERLPSRKAALTDKTLPKPAPLQTARSQAELPRINGTVQQVSTTSLWDNINSETAISSGMFDPFSADVLASHSSPPSFEQNASYPYSTTTTEANARAFGTIDPNSSANFSQFAPFFASSGMNGSEMHYYDPNTGMVYPVAPHPAALPYANQYGGGMGGADPMLLAYNYQQNHLQNVQQNPLFSSGMQNLPVQADGNFGAYSTNPYYQPYAQNWQQNWLEQNWMQTVMPGVDWSDPNAVYQAMMQQEAIRREVEAELAAKEAAELPDQEQKADSENETSDENWNVGDLMPLKVSSPLGKTLFSGMKSISPFNVPTGPHRGFGRPLNGVSWLDRPYYFGGFVGNMSGSELVSGMIEQESGGSGGLNFGYNFNEYWGLESRLHFASIDIQDTAAGRRYFEEWFTALYPDQTVPPLTTRANQLTILDAAVHYYPLGDAQFRPYLKYGLGVAQTSFIDTFGQKRRNNTLAMPLGLGLRFWWNRRLAVQADIVDNVIFSNGVAKTQNNWAFTVGLTYMFGGGSGNSTRQPYVAWPRVASR